MSNVYKASLTLAALLVILFVAFIVTQNARGEATTGLPATQITATTTSVGPQGVNGIPKTIFAANPACTARTISTVDGSGVGIYFLTGDSATTSVMSSTTLTSANGLFQAASTTVTYNSGLNGCGRWVARATASTTITVIEYQ